MKSQYTNKRHHRLLTVGLLNFEPWKILPVENGEKYSLDLKKRYPSSDLLPFAMRTDCDDVACWDLSREEGKVYIIHDFASIGWEQQREFDNFNAWFDDMVQDMFSFDDLA